LLREKRGGIKIKKQNSSINTPNSVLLEECFSNDGMTQNNFQETFIFLNQRFPILQTIDTFLKF